MSNAKENLGNIKLRGKKNFIDAWFGRNSVHFTHLHNFLNRNIEPKKKKKLNMLINKHLLIHNW